MPSLFISHSNVNDDLVNRIRERLADAGIDVWVDHHDIHDGENWEPEIEKALNNCSSGLFVLSSISLTSVACRNEYENILRNKKKLYVALVETISKEDLPERLKGIQYTDLIKKNYEKNLPRLIQTIQDDQTKIRPPQPPVEEAARPESKLKSVPSQIERPEEYLQPLYEFMKELTILRQLVTAIPYSISVKDINGCYEMANQADADLKRVKNPEEVKGKTDYDFFSHDTATRFLTNDQSIIHKKLPEIIYKDWFILHDGEGKTRLSVTKIPLISEKGIIGIVTIILNIT